MNVELDPVPDECRCCLASRLMKGSDEPCPYGDPESDCPTLN